MLTFLAIIISNLKIDDYRKFGDVCWKEENFVSVESAF